MQKISICRRELLFNIVEFKSDSRKHYQVEQFKSGPPVPMIVNMEIDDLLQFFVQFSSL